jgi:hypothetical protein
MAKTLTPEKAAAQHLTALREAAHAIAQGAMQLEAVAFGSPARRNDS